MKLLRGLFFAALNALLYCAFCRQVKIFRRIVGYFPNIAVPRKYHEKMLWRKIFDHNPLFVTFCDKLATKQYVKTRVPGLRIPETLWSGRSLRGAPKGLLNPGAIIKTNHGSSFNIFIDPQGFDLDAAETTAQRWLQTTYGLHHHEWAYYAVPKLLFLEQRIQPNGGKQLRDYFIRCADGKALFTSIKTGCKTESEKIYYFHTDGQGLKIHGGPASTCDTPSDGLPDTHLFEAIARAEALSKGIDYARYDFLSDGTALYAGEITVYPGAGIGKATPGNLPGADTLVNPHWDLKKSWFLGTTQSGWKKWYAQALKTVL